MYTCLLRATQGAETGNATRVHSLQPTVLLNPDIKNKMCTDEIFGSAISVRTLRSDEEAIGLANDTTCGLGYK
jgi:acyl-CoA reductase-like NAD-dependent aldehyde dehydrogenase